MLTKSHLSGKLLQIVLMTHHLYIFMYVRQILTIVLLNSDSSVFENTVDPDQMASGEAI